MTSLEQEIVGFFQAQDIPFHQHMEDDQRFVRLDFGFGDLAARRYFSFDAKEKRQRYRLDHWPETTIPEEHLFIVDDLAARKVLAFAPNSGLVVRDNVRGHYFLYTVVDLYLMPKQRLNRTIEKDVRKLKGKWLVDLRNGQVGASMADIFTAINTYLDTRPTIFQTNLACYGSYVGENVETGGITRRPEHWDKDVSETK